MDITSIRDLMVPVEAYAAVFEEATLKDAVNALEHAQEKLDRNRRNSKHAV